jgi:iron complex outermembrane receptor protein
MRTVRSTHLVVALSPAGPGLLVAQADALDSLLNTRISSAAKYEQTISEVAGAVTIVTADDIARFGYRTVAEVLAATRGFYLSNDRDYTYVGARGFSRPTDYNNRILILINGQVTNEPIWGGAYVASELGTALSAVERIEIIRGPGSAVYGTGAVFGVINIVTKDGGQVQGGTITGEGGSYGSRGATATFGQRLAPGTDLSLFASWLETDGADFYVPEYDAPETHDGLARGVDWEGQWGFGGKLQRGPLRVTASFNSRRKSIPTGAFAVMFGDDRSWTVDRTGVQQIAYERNVAKGMSLRTRAYGTGYWYKGDYAYAADDIYPEAAGAEGVGAEAVLTWDLNSANRLTAGAEALYYWRAEYFAPREGTRDFSISNPFWRPSLYLQNEYQITRTLSVLAGVRYDSYDEVGSALSPRGALIFTPTRATSFKLLYGRAYRAPSLAEREPSGYAIPDPDLTAEKGGTLELIYQQRLSRNVLGTVSLYDYRLNGLIDQVAEGGTDELCVFRNVSDAHAQGMDVGLDGRFGTLSGYASYSMQRAHDELTRIVLTNSPRHLLKGGAAFRLPGGVRPALEGRYESGRRTIADTWTDDFFVADLHLGFALPQRDGVLSHLDLSLRVRNLFGTRYTTPSGVEHVQPAIEQDGRALLTQLRHRF